MAINKKLIHFENRANFDTRLANNEINDTSIVFIQDTGELWTHGKFFCKDYAAYADEAGKLSIIQTKTYTNVIGTANNNPGAVFYFMSVRPIDWNVPCTVKYRINSSIEGLPTGTQLSIMTMTFARATQPSYDVWNYIGNTSYRPFYYHYRYFVTQAGYNAGYGHLIGLGMLYAYNPTTAANSRTFTIDILELDNATCTMFDSMTKYANVQGTGSTNFTSEGTFDGTTLGETHQGDRLPDYLAGSYYFRSKVNSDGYVGRYMLVMRCPNGTVTGLTTTNNSTGTTKTMYAGPLLLGDVFYYASTSAFAANGNFAHDGANIRNNYSLVDVRYTFNCGSTLVAYKPFFIVGSMLDGYFYLDLSQPWSQEWPTENEEGKVYILVGHAYDTYRTTFELINPVYTFKNGKLQLYNLYSAQVDWNNIIGTPSTFTPSTHTHPYTDLTGSTTTADLAIVSNGTANGWTLKTLGSNAFNSIAYLPLAGGTMTDTAVILRKGPNAAWVNGRTIPIIKTNSYNGYSPILSMKTTDGSWDLGVYTSNTAYLTYISDQNFNNGTNEPTYQLIFPKATGTIALTKLLTDFVTMSTTQTITGVKTFSNGFKLNTATSWDNADRTIPFSTTDDSTKIAYVYNDNDKGLTYNPNTGALKAGSFVKRGGTSSQFLKADGSVDTNAYITASSSITGNAASATEFASAQSVTLTGDTTGTASSKAGWSITTTTKYLTGTSSGNYDLATTAMTTAMGNGKVTYYYKLTNNTTGLFAATTNANSMFAFNKHDGNYDSQLGFSSNGNIYYRNFANVAPNTTLAWKQIAFTDSNITGQASYAANVGSAGTLGTNYVAASKVIAACNWYDTVTGSDTDSVINRWDEIVNFVAGFEETPDLATYLSNNYLAKTGNSTTSPMTGTIYVKDVNPLVLQSTNQDLDIWRVTGNTTGSLWDNTFGFYLRYNGTGLGNDNSLSLWANNQTGNDVEVYRVKLDGILNFLTAPTINGTAISLTTHNHDDRYLLLAGGTMTGPLKWTDANALPQASSTNYFVTIDGFADGGTTKWISKANALASLTGLTSSAKGSIAVPIYWTGSAFATVQATFGSKDYGEHNANNIKSNGLWYYTSNGPTTTLGASTADGALYSQAYSTSWAAQIAQDYRNGNLFTRGLNNGTWSTWRKVWNDGNDGTGSGLDADLLDGQEGSYYLKEANLTWGGKNFSGNYGPLDAAMVAELGACRTMFSKAAGLVIEYSTDNGTTWNNYEASDSAKIALFSIGWNFYTGANSTSGGASTNNMLRVTLRTSAAGIYTQLNKFVIFVGSNGSTGCYCTIRCRTLQNYEDDIDTWVTLANLVPISGWTGYNVININPTTTYGNTKNTQYGEWLFIFGYTGFSGSSTGLYINKIFGFGGMGWVTPSNMAKTGHLYSYDAVQNATFPALITATAFKKTNGTSSQFLKADGSVDSNTYITSASIGNGTLSLQASGTTKTSFTANQSGNATFNIATGTTNGTISVGGTNVTVKGMGSSGVNKDFWIGVNGLYVNFDAENKTFRRGTATTDADTTLGTATYPWKALYADTVYENGSTLTSTYLKLSGGTMTGAINISTSNSAVDTTKGINFTLGSTTGHIGLSALLGIYSSGNIVIRPNGGNNTGLGLDISLTSFKYNNTNVSLEGHTHSSLNISTSGYLYLSATTTTGSTGTVTATSGKIGVPIQFYGSLVNYALNNDLFYATVASNAITANTVYLGDAIKSKTFVKTSTHVPTGASSGSSSSSGSGESITYTAGDGIKIAGTQISTNTWTGTESLFAELANPSSYDLIYIIED